MSEQPNELGGPSRAIVNPMDLTGRVFMVTGGSSGIGQGIALRLSELGARVVIVGRNRARLEETLAGLAGEGHRAVEFELTSSEAIPEWLQKVTAETGPLEGIVHSAGVSVNIPLRVLSRKLLHETMAINLDAGFMLARGFRRKGVRGARGSLVFISSVAAMRGQAGLSVYAASKGGLMAATRSLAVELAPENIRVNCVVPGFVDTPMYQAYADMAGSERIGKITAAHPLGIGQPEDVANLVAFLLSDGARWITGESINVDGGYLA